ncbi:hypothetical protein [Halosolutus halophilus]|uniref:hypothetical protein n=1 Tax=Halosolutus halophilus TaxID=1552990 RepID=UPI0022352D19|nr:hypothetical protein [Halosolutus halophilus]
MISRPHPQHDSPARQPPTGVEPITGGIAFVLAALALLVIASYPVYAAAFGGALAVAVALVRVGGPALGRRLHGRMTELDVPGLGTVQIRVTAR